MAQGKKPNFNIAFSRRIQKGEYKQGPSLGLWKNEDNGPKARGSVEGERLEEFAKFVLKTMKKGKTLSYSLFVNKPKDDDEDGEEEEEEDDEKEEEEDEDDKSEKNGKKGKKGERKGAEEEDEEEEEEEEEDSPF